MFSRHVCQADSNDGSQLLHRVIPQSGSALELWTIDEHPDESFLRTAEMTNCFGSTVSEMISCMKEMPFQDVVNASNHLYVS